MVRTAVSQRFKVAAIDLDGTLLGPEGNISAGNAAAVQRLRLAGLQVVLASGRHFKTMRRYAEALPGVEWVISCQGGELCDVNRTAVFTSQCLSSDLVSKTMQLAKSFGLSAVAYGADGIYTDPAWHPDLKFYSDFARHQPTECPLQEILGFNIFKVLWTGSPQDVDRAVRENPVQALSIQMIQTHSRFLEFMPVGLSKVSGLKILAQRLGVDRSEVIAFGDGDNDVPMFEWAGISVAMAHGWPAALRKATYCSPEGPSDTALARAVEMLFERGLLTAGKGSLAEGVVSTAGPG